jgi:hypothetical protein
MVSLANAAAPSKAPTAANAYEQPHLNYTKDEIIFMN